MSEEVDPLSLIGTTIAEKYAVDSVVGVGGFALVYKARHLIWRRPVAIKVFKALADFPQSERAALMEQFVQEGALMAELSERSASIVQARDIGMLTIGDNTWVPFMVLEWLEGASLDKVLEEERRRGLPLRSIEEALKLLEPAAQALSLAHSKRIAHRDVKPANIFILGDARQDGVSVKLLDFGIAKVASDAAIISKSFERTGGPITAFTPAYAAPEQFSRSHGATGPWTDVFALGLVLAEVLSGREALDGGDVVQLAVSASRQSMRPTPRALGASVSDAVEGAFQKAVAVRPGDRYRSVSEFWSDLRAAVNAPGASVARMPAIPKAGSLPRVPISAGDSAKMALAATALPAAPTVVAPGAAPTVLELSELVELARTLTLSSAT
jgi:eukaryotic-like serine/threonine-protein kinase